MSQTFLPQARALGVAGAALRDRAPFNLTASEVQERERNPQARGFNYGQPIALPKPPEWDHWNAIADAARLAPVIETQRAWAYDHAIRAVRIATTAEQHRDAVAACRLLFPEPDAFERVAGIARPAVEPTAENLTDRAIRERNILRLIAAARRVISVFDGPDTAELDTALLPFANVDTTEA